MALSPCNNCSTNQRVTALEEDGPFGTLSAQQLLDQRVTVLEDDSGGGSGVDSDLITTLGDATKVFGAATVNVITTQNNSEIARFKTDKIDLLQDVHLNHIDLRPSKLISTDDLIFETPGGLYKDSVAAENEFIKRSEINDLITQRLNSAFLVSNQIGLPSTTECTVTRESTGNYKVQFNDTWNAQFNDKFYSVILTQNSRTLPNRPAPAKLAHFFTSKTNTRFEILVVEQEDTVNGTIDSPFDPGRLDFACIRGAVVFAQGSFTPFTL